MAYLLGKSTASRSIYTAELPDGYCLEPPHNRMWEVRISKEDFDRLPKRPSTSMVVGTEMCQLYVVDDQ